MMMVELRVRKGFSTAHGSCDLEDTMKGFQKLERIADGVRLSNVQICIRMCF